MRDFDPRYCPLCAAELQVRHLHGHDRPACPECTFIHFRDPKLAVGVLVTDPEGRLLYTKRNHAPRMGAWAFPSGFVDQGEEVRTAGIREAREETGLEIELDGLLGVFSQTGDPVVFIVYHAHAVGGTLRPGDEAEDVRFFPADDLPPPAFPFDEEIVAVWRARPRA